MPKRASRTISVLYRYSQRFLTRRLRPLGLEVGEFPALMQIYTRPGITQEQISAETGMDKGTTARSVGQLEQMGLILREVDQVDRRVNHSYPSAEGLKLQPEFQAVADELRSVLYGGMTSQEVQATARLLERMRKNMIEEIKRQTGITPEIV